MAGGGGGGGGAGGCAGTKGSLAAAVRSSLGHSGGNGALSFMRTSVCTLVIEERLGIAATTICAGLVLIKDTALAIPAAPSVHHSAGRMV